MKPLKQLILGLVSLVLLSACGSGGGGNSSSAASKDLFSKWTRTDGLVLDLSTASFSLRQSIDVNFTNGAYCTCGAAMAGSQDSGTYAMGNCHYVSGGSGDPGCAALQVSGTYTKSSSTLTMCDASCGTYK